MAGFWARNREELVVLVVAGVALWVIQALLRALGRWQWSRYVAPAVFGAIAAALFWSRYAAYWIYIALPLAFVSGVATGILLARWPVHAFLVRRRVRLSELAKRGTSWWDPLATRWLDPRKWQFVESKPPGMVQGETGGLIVSWRGGYKHSGLLVARVELDQGEYSVDFAAKADQVGAGWDAGVCLYAEAVPRATPCAALQFLPPPYSKCGSNALCFAVNGEVLTSFPIEVGEWQRATIEISGRRARATVNRVPSGWERMETRPRELLVGPTPADWEATGGPARYVFKDLAVRPSRPVSENDSSP